MKFRAFWRYVEGKASMTLMGVSDTIADFRLCHQCQENVTKLSEQILKSLRTRLGDRAYAELKNSGFITDLLFQEINGMLGVRYGYEEAIKSEYC
jgi:hypothetical protein